MNETFTPVLTDEDIANTTVQMSDADKIAHLEALLKTTRATVVVQQKTIELLKGMNAFQSAVISVTGASIKESVKAIDETISGNLDYRDEGDGLEKRQLINDALAQLERLVKEVVKS